MPTLLQTEGFRFFFYSNERLEPPHVHVEKGDGEANQAMFKERWNEHFRR